MPASIMVKAVRIHDEKNWLMLTSGFLPACEAFKLAAPQHPKSRYEGKFDFDAATNDEAAAWTLTTLCRHIGSTYHSLQSGGYDACKLPLKTWVLGKGAEPNAQFASWFEQSPNDTNYRVIMHWTPRQAGSRIVSPQWDRVYDARPNLVRRNHWTKDQLYSARKFLQTLLNAHAHGDEAFNEILAQTGHPYVISGGLMPGT